MNETYMAHEKRPHTKPHVFTVTDTQCIMQALTSLIITDCFEISSHCTDRELLMSLGYYYYFFIFKSSQIKYRFVILGGGVFCFCFFVLFPLKGKHIIHITMIDLSFVSWLYSLSIVNDLVQK